MSRAIPPVPVSGPEPWEADSGYAFRRPPAKKRKRRKNALLSKRQKQRVAQRGTP